MTVNPRAKKLLEQITTEQPYPLIFASLSGAHLYGFPSPDSDYDLRGVHSVFIKDLIGLNDPIETLDSSDVVDGMELDLVTHDVKTYCLLLLKKNGNVLEQIFSPHIIVTTPEHEELKTIAQGCITLHFAHHYLGFSRNKWDEFNKQTEKRIKTILYVYRVLLTGIHLMQTGRVDANLKSLNDVFKLTYIDELIHAKRQNGEKALLQDADVSFHGSEYHRLTEMLEKAHENSHLPEAPIKRDELNEWLINTRMIYGKLS